ncbi:hypothetical protein [Paenibacillus sp. FSL K6-2862]|uniref:hypothetical protein n=1 Tax=Paenibacillus sp. FSL K6-2862 TaxID=2921484 RepID=UPI0030FAA053
MLKRLFKKNTIEQHFWDWFSRNNEKYHNLVTSEQEQLFDELHEQLMRVHGELTFEFSSLHMGIREFVLSGEGITEMIPVVQGLVDSAPPLEGWKVTAFRPRMETDIQVNFGNYLLKADNVTFDYETIPKGTMLDITLFIPQYSDEMKSAIYILLDGILGEYDVMTRIRFIEFRLSGRSLSIPLKQLPIIVDNLQR